MFLNENILQKIYSGLLFTLIALTSFAYFPFGINRFEYPKFISLGLLGTVFIILTAFYGLQTIKDRFPKYGLILLTVYWIGQIGSFILSEDHAVSLFGSAFRHQGLYANLLYTGVLLAAFYFFSSTTDKTHQRMFQYIGITGSIAALIALMSYSDLFFSPKSSLGRAYGTLGQPNYLASFLIVSLPTLWLLRNRTLKYALGALTLAALFLTGSRAAWIALVVSCFAAGFIMWQRNRSKILAYVGFGIIALSIICIGINSRHPQSVLKRFSLHGYDAVSIGVRLSLWKASYPLITKRPIFGYGQDMIMEYLPLYLPPKTQISPPYYFDRLHSEPLDILATGGIFSLIGYLGLFFHIYYTTIKRTCLSGWSTTEAVCVFSLTTLFIYHCFNFSTITSNVLWSIVLGYLIAASAQPQTNFVAPTKL